MKEEIQKADIAIANLEVTLGGKPYKGYPCFSSPDEFVYAAQDAGFNLLLTSNNHSLDRGKAGLERTLQVLDSLEIMRVGTYRDQEEREQNYPLLVEQNNFRLVFLNYTYGTNGFEDIPPNVVSRIDKEIMAADIEKAKSMYPDLIFTCMHWGEEYHLTPGHQQKELADWLLEQGVDHVIGAHPHVVQPMEMRTDSINGKQNLVVYSLENFVSNMSQVNTDGGLIVKIEFQKDSVITITDCGYALVWTAHSTITGKRIHEVVPAFKEYPELPGHAENRRKTFVKNARELFRRYNKEIEEYFF